MPSGGDALGTLSRLSVIYVEYYIMGLAWGPRPGRKLRRFANPRPRLRTKTTTKEKSHTPSRW